MDKEAIDESPIHENEHYQLWIEENVNEVTIGGMPYSQYYIVENKGTGVVEFKTPSLPQAMMIIESANSELVNAPWTFLTSNFDTAENGSEETKAPGDVLQFPGKPRTEPSNDEGPPDTSA